MAPDTGVIASEKDLQLGFLRQDIDFVQGRTVLEEAQQAFEEIKSLELQLDEVNHQLATRTDYESDAYSAIIEDLSDLTHRYELIGGYNYQGETEKILQGLGFKRADFDKKTETFSGGWRMRIELAKLLLQTNDVLLLDEPTNHLDIESIIWLEQFLNQYSGAVVIVSHDKMFLDNVTNRSIEISLGRIYDYNKPYSQYLVLRSELKELQLNAQKNQEKQIQQTERLIEKFRAKASKATMAQSLIKKLDKIDRIEVDEDDNSVMKLRFPISVTPGKVVLEIDGVSKSYGDNQVLSEIDLLIERDSKTAFVGQNGQGKSTLAKIIATLEAEQVAALGKQIPDFKAGDTIRVGYKVTEGTRSRVQNYEGVCISRKNGKGIAGSFTVRKISFGEGVERVFPLHSTNIESITVVRRGRVRRAKLYYLRSRRGKSARISEDSNYKPADKQA